MTNAAVPMGAVAVSDAIYHGIVDNAPAGIELFHGYTYSGHPLAAAAAIAAVDLHRAEDLPGRARGMENYFEDGAHSLKGLPNVIDVRNYGLILGLELESIPGKAGARAFDIYVKCFERGLLIRQSGDILALSPPLIIERAQIDQIFTLLAEVLRGL